MLKRKEKNKRFNRIVNCTMLLQSEEQMLKKILLGHKMTGFCDITCTYSGGNFSSIR